MNKRDLILDTMQELFREGTAGTASVGDIAKRAGIAKGGLYYYFRSKEDVLDALIERQYAHIISTCKDSLDAHDGNALTKFELLIKTYRTSYFDPSIDEYLHNPMNASLHQKSLTTILLALRPLLSDVISQGVQEGLFTCQYPTEFAEFILSSFTFIFDRGLFTWSLDELSIKAKALAIFLEQSLVAQKNSFDFIYKYWN